MEQTPERTVKVDVLYYIIEDKFGDLHIADSEGLKDESVVREVIDRLSKKIKQPCYIYLIFNPDNGLHKIGVTIDIHRRLKQLQDDTGSDLEIVSTGNLSNRAEAYEVEARFHRALGQFRKHGEWFDLDQDVIAWIVDVFSLPAKNMAWPIIGHEPGFGGFKRECMQIKEEWR